MMCARRGAPPEHPHNDVRPPWCAARRGPVLTALQDGAHLFPAEQERGDWGGDVRRRGAATAGQALAAVGLRHVRQDGGRADRGCPPLPPIAPAAVAGSALPQAAPRDRSPRVRRRRWGRCRAWVSARRVAPARGGRTPRVSPPWRLQAPRSRTTSAAATGDDGGGASAETDGAAEPPPGAAASAPAAETAAPAAAAPAAAAPSRAASAVAVATAPPPQSWSMWVVVLGIVLAIVALLLRKAGRQ